MSDDSNIVGVLNWAYDTTLIGDIQGGPLDGLDVHILKFATRCGEEKHIALDRHDAWCMIGDLLETLCAEGDEDAIHFSAFWPHNEIEPEST